MGCPWRTIENRGDEGSGEIGLLRKVQEGCDVWSIRIVGSRFVLRVPHDPDVYEEGLGGGRTRELLTEKRPGG